MCDFDGYSSFAITYRCIKKINPNANIEILIHSGKQHGLSPDIHIKDDTDLVVMTDSSSNDIIQHKALKDRGIDVLCIDHHECDNGYSPYAVVINNQLANNVYNKNACGAFVCYKFFKAVDEYLFDDIADEFRDVVSFANVADVMDLHEKETRYFVYEGLKDIKNTFLRAMIEVKSYELENKLNINSVGWTISPMVNGVVRSGTEEEKFKMAQAFISDDYDFCLEVAKMCKNVKARQDNAVKSALKKIELKISVKEEDRCIIADVGKNLSKEHTGLVAGKLADKYKLPTLLYRDIEDKKRFIGGSYRGISNISEDLRTDILNSKLAEYSQGHSLAGGWSINKDDVDKLKKYLNNLYKDKEVINGKTYEVDFILDEDTLSYDIISELAAYEDEWGNGIPEPLILFKDVSLYIDEHNIKGTKSKTLIFEVNGIKFVKKYLTNVLKDSVLEKSFMTADIIGKCVNNFYNGNTYPQVEVIDISIL